MADLPVISPDESGDVPRCRKECPRVMWAVDHEVACANGSPERIDYDIAHPEEPCIPRIRAISAELREIKARRCDGCKHWGEGIENVVVGFCHKYGQRRSSDDFCRNGWEPRR